jgi:hypothetical protein
MVNYLIMPSVAGILAFLPVASANADIKSEIKSIAAVSECSKYSWNDRGVASSGYVNGVAVTYARAVCNTDRPETKLISEAPDRSKHANDGLVAYERKFLELGFKNISSGDDARRATYAMLIGLGVRESSGRYCEGRDVSMCFTSAESAEAGLIQTSYGASGKSPELRALMKEYQEGKRNCFVADFGGPKMCKIRFSKNPSCPGFTSETTGAGAGADWQQLTKSCPAFAIEYGAVVLRRLGGSGKNGTPKGEFGPIRTGSVEIVPACITLLRDVEAIVSKSKDVCKSF